MIVDLVSSPDKAIRDEGRTGLEAAIRESKEVGGSSVLLVPGRVSGPNETHEHVWERSITEIRKVIPIAAVVRSLFFVSHQLLHQE